MAQMSSALRKYTVGWICAVETEYVVALSLLDEVHPAITLSSPNDNNVYTLGRIGAHDVVMACLPRGIYGLVSAASVAKDMHGTFPSIRFALMVGIGGGAPSPEHDIRLGDVVVSQPVGGGNGVIHYNFGKVIQGKEFQLTGSLNAPPKIILSAMHSLSTQHIREGHRITESIDSMLKQNPRLRWKYGRPRPETDRLYKSNFVYEDKIKLLNTVDEDSMLIDRKPRGEYDNDPAIHYGLIASADCLMKDATTRDKLAQQGVLCFEMEAAGLMGFECVVIRGICDYADTHKNDAWQGYAACTAAAYAKELLSMIPATAVEQTAPMKNHQDRVVDDILPALETRLEGLVDNVNRLGMSAASQQASFEGTSTALTEIRQGVSMLNQASSEYKEKLDSLKDSKAAADHIKFVTEKIKRIDSSQELLAKDLRYLTQLIEEQKLQGTSREVVRQWESLQEDAEDQTLALEDLTGMTKQTLENTQSILDEVIKIASTEGVIKANRGVGIAGKSVEMLSGAGQFIQKARRTKDKKGMVVQGSESPQDDAVSAFSQPGEGSGSTTSTMGLRNTNRIKEIASKVVTWPKHGQEKSTYLVNTEEVRPAFLSRSSPSQFKLPALGIRSPIYVPENRRPPSMRSLTHEAAIPVGQLALPTTIDSAPKSPPTGPSCRPQVPFKQPHLKYRPAPPTATPTNPSLMQVPKKGELKKDKDDESNLSFQEKRKRFGGK